MRTTGTLNYPGNVDPTGEMMGPDYDGNYWMAIGRVYDEESNVTHVDFKLAARSE